MPATDDAKATWLTQDAHDRLSNELNELIANRPVIAAEINARREEGDLKENGGYHAAKEEQGKIEARIRVLTQLLRTATVGDAPESHGVVEPGTVVTATIQGDKSVFLVGNREMAGNSDLDVYSEGSPLGTAIMGLKIGDTKTYTAPNGKAITVEILKVETYQP